MESMLLRAEEAAQLLGVSKSKVFLMIAHGELVSVRFGRCVRIPRDAVREWVKRQLDGQSSTGCAAQAEETDRS